MPAKRKPVIREVKGAHGAVTHLTQVGSSSPTRKGMRRSMLPTEIDRAGLLADMYRAATLRPGPEDLAPPPGPAEEMLPPGPEAPVPPPAPAAGPPGMPPPAPPSLYPEDPATAGELPTEDPEALKRRKAGRYGRNTFPKAVRT